MHMQNLHFDARALFDLPVAWLFCVISPFGGFNFNDAADFVVPILIITTLSYILYRDIKVKDSARSVKFASNAALWLAILGPLLPMLFLYLMSWRATIVLGHWPSGLADDPKHTCPADALFQELDYAQAYAMAFAGWTLITLPALVLHLRRSMSMKYFCWLVAIFFAAWAAFACEPMQRFSWWLG